MSVPTIRDPQERSVLEPQRRWGSSRPDASLGLEKVALIRVEKGRVVIANQLQVTRRPELSEQQIARRTVLALEQVADKWGWPPPRFYWVPSVKLESEPGEEEMTRLIRRTLLRAGAGMEQGTSKQ